MGRGFLTEQENSRRRLMLIFQWLRTSAPYGFLTAFQATFRIAAAIPAALVFIDLRRGWRSRPGAKEPR